MDEFYKKVARRTEIIVMRTQNVTSKLGMSGTAIESRKNAFLKTMVAFQSQGNAIYNMVRRAMRRYRNGDIDLPEFAGILAMALLGNAMWSVLVSHFVTLKILTGKKPPITSKSMASELLRENIGNLYGGSMINPFVRVVTQAWQGKNVFGGAHMENVAESVFNDVAMGAAQVLTSPMKEGNDKKIKALKKSSLKFLNGLLPAAGVPVMPFKEGINLLSLLDKD